MEKNEKKYELNTNLISLFSGTYETVWEVTEYDEEGDQELEVEYNTSDFMKSIIDAYKDQEPQILRDLKYEVDFITNIKFQNTYYSPREYNFSTDTIDFTLTVNTVKLNKTLKDLKDNEDFETYLKDNYSSRDGFMSFTPDNYRDLKEAIESNNSESDQAIGALIRYLTQINNSNTLNDIEEMTFEDWRCNGYNGLNYSIVEE